MKGLLITLLSFLSINMIQGASILWKSEFAEKENTAVKTTFEVNKGSFLRLFLTISKKNQDFPPKATGKLLFPAELKADFIFSNEVVIDTNESRNYIIYFGVSCFSQITAKDYKLTFKIDTADNDFIEWPELTIQLKDTPEQFKVSSLFYPINSDSFAPYFVDNVNTVANFTNILNVDVFSFTFKDIQGGSQGAGVIDDFSVNPFDVNIRNIIQLKGFYSGGSFESEATEFSATITSNNKCFQPKETTFRWKVFNVNLPKITQFSAKDIAEKVEEVKGVENIAGFNLVVATYPLQVSCGATSRDDDFFLNQNNVTNQTDFVYKYHPDLLYYQTYTTGEGAIPIRFKNANRFVRSFHAVCYLQTIRNINGNKDFSDTLKVTLGKRAVTDGKLSIKAEEPTPSQCALWTFEASLKGILFGEKVVDYCTNYFGGKESAMNSKGCLICEEASPDFLTSNQTNICMRSLVNCHSTYDQNIKKDFGAFIQTIDSTEKIQDKLKITVSKVISVNHTSDNDAINPEVIITGIVDYTSTEAILDSITLVTQPISCLVKELNTKYFSTVTEADFKLDHTKEINLFHPGTPIRYEVEFATTGGYDSNIYGVVLMCHNLAQYQYHYYYTEPFLTLSILKTDKKAIEDKPVKPEKCTDKNKLLPHCMPLKYRDSGVIIKQYSSDLPDDLHLFEHLPSKYQKLKIEDEIVELEKIQDAKSFNDKIIFLGELLGKIICLKDNDFQKCRKFKEDRIPSFIDKIKSRYENDLMATIDTNKRGEMNVPILSYMLFVLSNNVESYSKLDVVNKLSSFSHIVVTKFHELIELIKKRDIVDDKKSTSIKDFYKFMVLHHVNMFEIYRMLEADKIIKNKEGSQFLEASDELKLIKSDFDLLLTYMVSTNITSFKYDNIFILSTQGREQPNSDKKPFNFDLGIKMSIQPVDLFEKNKELKLIQMFYLEKHPFFSINLTEYYPHTVSLRLIGDKVSYDSKTIEPSPEIYFNMTGVDVNFKEGLNIDIDKKEFNVTNSKTTWKSQSINNSMYSIITISKVGDYTIGKPSVSSWLWLIIVCSILGVAVIGGIGYLIWMIFKNKKSEATIENIDPLLAN